MIDLLRNIIHNKKVLILGYGKEGQSSYTLIRKYFPTAPVTIADKNEKIADLPEIKAKDCYTSTLLGEAYLSTINNFDVIFKSPGISFRNINLKPGISISSQSELFLQRFSGQCIGVTGTKGKSTTCSLIHHILEKSGKKSLLTGNIGLAPFSVLDKISPESLIVYELSSHQLEHVNYSPHIAVLLNLFPEHLDHYQSFEKYCLAKSRIFTHAKNDDVFIYNEDHAAVKKLIDTSRKPSGTKHTYSLEKKCKPGMYIQNHTIMYHDGISDFPVLKVADIQNLPGIHNLQNIMAAALACIAAGVLPGEIAKNITSFKGLEHRLEYVGKYRDIHFYNDSIATIPEAAIEALKAIPEVDTLILGGFDRGLDYTELINFVNNSAVRNLLFIGEAGARMFSMIDNSEKKTKNYSLINSLEQALSIAVQKTEKNKACLLSPAAASYDMFENFEHRGHVFKKIARAL